MNKHEMTEFAGALVLFAFCLAGFYGQRWAAGIVCFWFLAYVASVLARVRVARKEEHAREGGNTSISPSNGIHIRGWWCNRKVPGKDVPCDTFNGEEHQIHTICRHCEQPK